MGISAVNVRNQIQGNVREIVRGPVVSEVVIQTTAGIITSVITTRSVDDLQLDIGRPVIALIKSTEVSIAVI